MSNKKEKVFNGSDIQEFKIASASEDYLSLKKARYKFIYCKK